MKTFFALLRKLSQRFVALLRKFHAASEWEAEGHDDADRWGNA